MNRNRVRCFLIVSAVFIFAAQLRAQEELSWSDVVAQTKQHNPTLKKADQAVQQARQSLERTYTNFLPQVSLNGATSQSDSDTNGYSRSNSLGVSGSLPLFTGFSNTANTRMRTDELNIAQASYERSVADVIFNLRSSFIALLWAQQTVKLSGEILSRRDENLNMIQLRYESGNEDKGSLARMQADKVQSEYDLAKAQRNLRTAQIALLKTIGRDDSSAVTVKGDFSTLQPSSQTVNNSLIAMTPEYRIAKYTLDRSEHNVTSAKSEFYPSLTLNAGSSKFGPSWAPENNSWNLGLNLSYPIFPGGRNIYDVRIALTGKNISEQAFRETSQGLETKLIANFNNYVDATANVGVRQYYLDASQLQSTISTTKYLNGLSSYQDWYTIENDFISSERSLLNSRRDAALAEAQWKNFLGEGN